MKIIGVFFIFMFLSINSFADLGIETPEQAAMRIKIEKIKEKIIVQETKIKENFEKSIEIEKKVQRKTLDKLLEEPAF